MKLEDDNTPQGAEPQGEQQQQGTGEQQQPEGDDPSGDGAEGEEPSGEEGAGEGEGEGGERQASGEGDKDKQGKPAPKGKQPAKKHWAEGRLDKKTAENHQLREEIARLKGLKPQGQGESDADFQARVDAAANVKARELSANQAFLKACDEATASGQETYGKDEFNLACLNINKLVDFNNPDEARAYQQFTQSCLDTGEGSKLFFVLGQDLDEAQRIMALSPSQQGIALARLAAKDAPDVTKAPKPVQPLGGKGTSRVQIKADETASDKLSMKEWMERRNADVKAGKSSARI